MRDQEVDSLESIRGELAARVRARTPEIERAFVLRVRASVETEENAEFLADLRALARESISYALAAVEEGERWAVVVPPGVAAQIRTLAAAGVPLEEMLRGYSVVHEVLMEFITEEMGPLPPEVLAELLKVQSQQSNALMMAFTAEYTDEAAQLQRSSSQRLAERVQGLLAGEPAETAGFDYDFDGWHLGVVAQGQAPELTMRRLAEALGCRLLLVPRAPGTIWAWLGARQGLPFAELERIAEERVGDSVALAVGESRQGVAGWRLTHREAQMALTVMLRRPRQRLTRCADVALLAALTRDEAAARFLIDAYLGPLERHRNAAALRETLSAYLGAGYNAASAAASLGVDRHTVERRLRKVEASIGRPIDTCRAELEMALRVEALQA